TAGSPGGRCPRHRRRGGGAVRPGHPVARRRRRGGRPGPGGSGAAAPAAAGVGALPAGLRVPGRGLCPPLGPPSGCHPAVVPRARRGPRQAGRVAVNALLQELGKKLAEKWVTLLVLPGILLAATTLVALTLGHARALDLAGLVDAGTARAQAIERGGGVAVAFV